jgi:hypothetical protein
MEQSLCPDAKKLVAKPLKKFPAFIDLDGSLLYPQKPATGPFPVPDGSLHHIF